MREMGHESSAATVADYYGEAINGFVYDRRDAGLRFPMRRVTMFDTIM